MGNYNFDDDLANEYKLTQKVIKFLESKGYELLEDNHDNRYDLKMKHLTSGKITTIEIKEDIYCRRSGNVAVEFHSRGKPSGISTTQSDFYLEVLHLDKVSRMYVIISVDKLKRLVETGRYGSVTGGDEGSGTRMYLVPKEDIIRVGKVIRRFKIVQ